MIIPVINEKDEIIKYKHISEVVDTDIFRVSCLWVKDKSGKVLLARRAFNKRHYAGRWGPAVEGIVEKGETYESNIIKEAEEEIDLKDIKPKLGARRLFDRKVKYFVQEFSLTLPDGYNDFKIVENEVAEVKWFEVEELKNKIAKNPSHFVRKLRERMGFE